MSKTEMLRSSAAGVVRQQDANSEQQAIEMLAIKIEPLAQALAALSEESKRALAENRLEMEQMRNSFQTYGESAVLVLEKYSAERVALGDLGNQLSRAGGALSRNLTEMLEKEWMVMLTVAVVSSLMAGLVAGLLGGWLISLRQPLFPAINLDSSSVAAQITAEIERQRLSSIKHGHSAASK